MQVDLPAIGIRLFYSDQIQTVHVIATVLRAEEVVVNEKHWRHLLARSAALKNIARVLVGKILSRPLLRRWRGSPKSRGKLKNDDRIWTETLQNRGYRRIKSGKNGSDADNRSRPHHHAQHCQKSPQLVSANRLQRKPCGV